MTTKKLRCAIYTRKSTEEGLEKEFNTLEAQREAGEAYIKSQMHEGWHVVPTQYDDGGFTGGNMERPALQQLMADIKAGKVHIIVVYKVDRLTRSLADFAKIVDMLDHHNVSFVSVTQQFNTSTSMGRLTLNVLLSFAQFEREVISERVRDKVAASKKKGMWMGGYPPLGYVVKDRKLVLVEQEAELVRQIYELYLSHRSAYTVLKLLNEAGHVNKRWITKKKREMGGKKFTKTAIYRILKDPVYVGKIRYKETLYDGQHTAIIDEETWEQVQALLKEQDVHRTNIRMESGTLLRGKCVDGQGRSYTTTYTMKQKYGHIRYYLNQHTRHRIRGDNLEEVIFATITYVTLNPEYMQMCFDGEYTLLSEEDGVYRLQNLWAVWNSLPEKQQCEIAQKLVEKITILKNSTTIRIRYDVLNELLKTSQHVSDAEPVIPILSSEPTVVVHDDALEITLNVIFKVKGRINQAFTETGKAFETFPKVEYNMTLINALAKSHKWNHLVKYEGYTPDQIAQENRVSKGYVSSMLRLMLLSPEIIEGILSGQSYKHLNLRDLLRAFPCDWNEQKVFF